MELSRRAPTGGDLVSESSAAAVDHHAHLTFVVDAHLLRGVVVVDLVHHLDLSVVVSCSQRTQLQHRQNVHDLLHMLTVCWRVRGVLSVAR